MTYPLTYNSGKVQLVDRKTGFLVVMVVVVEYGVDLVSDLSTVGHLMVAFTQLTGALDGWWGRKGR